VAISDVLPLEVNRPWLQIRGQFRGSIVNPRTKFQRNRTTDLMLSIEIYVYAILAPPSVLDITDSGFQQLRTADDSYCIIV